MVLLNTIFMAKTIQIKNLLFQTGSSRAFPQK